MRGLTALCVLLLLLSAGFTGLRVRAAEQRSRSELIALEQRATSTRQLLTRLVPASRDQIKALRAQAERLDERAGRRRASLLDRAFATPPPALAELLDPAEGRFPSLDETTRTELQQLGALEPALELGLASVLTAFEGGETLRLEDLSLREEGLARSLPHARGLRAADLELVALGDLDAALSALETLVPGRGEPLLVVEHASLRRLEPELWETLPDSLAEPPVRLWVQLSLVFGEGAP